MKNPLKSVKKYMSDHSEAIAVGVGITGVIALYALAIVAAVKQTQNEAAHELMVKQALLEANARGDMILPNSDGSYWLVPRDTTE